MLGLEKDVWYHGFESEFLKKLTKNLPTEWIRYTQMYFTKVQIGLFEFAGLEYVDALLTPGVNFTNILRAAFWMKVIYTAFLYLKFGFCNYLGQDYWHKSCS